MDAERTATITGGVDGYLCDLLVAGWEAEVASDSELVAWGERIGFGAAARLLAELAVVERRTREAHQRWRAEFLDSLRPRACMGEGEP